MNAIQPSRPTLRPVPSPPKSLPKQSAKLAPKQIILKQTIPKPTIPKPRVTSRRHSQQHRKKYTHQAIAFELSTKLVVNVLLTVAAASTLLKLVPYHLVQQEKLHSIQAEVADVEGRVDQLRADFGRQFDPQQTMSVMQEQSNRVSPTQRRIVWSTPLDANQND